MYVTSFYKTHYYKIFYPPLSALKIAFYDPKMPFFELSDYEEWTYYFKDELKVVEDACNLN